MSICGNCDYSWMIEDPRSGQYPLREGICGDCRKKLVSRAISCGSCGRRGLRFLCADGFSFPVPLCRSQRPRSGAGAGVFQLGQYCRQRRRTVEDPEPDALGAQCGTSRRQFPQSDLSQRDRSDRGVPQGEPGNQLPYDGSGAQRVLSGDGFQVALRDLHAPEDGQ